MKCGREPGGVKAQKLGICPSAIDTTFNGFNQGINAGRLCWLVAGTFCGNTSQGTYAEKRTPGNKSRRVLADNEEGYI